MLIEGQIVNIGQREFFSGSIEVNDGVITDIRRHDSSLNHFIIPGFIDAHVHIESSMLTPQLFGQMIVKRGTVAIVTDPHEIANVMGVPGIEFMLSNSEKSPAKCYFAIPSCVPATPFDAAGSTLSVADVEKLAASGRFIALAEMMNAPGVIHRDPEVMAKLQTARKHGLPIDGHAPALSGSELAEYISHQINTDHECATLPEAQEKIKAGMKILIREGSAARNYEALKPLIATHPNDVMFCTDDSHPDEIIERGHIDKIVRKAIEDGFDLFDVLRIATLNPIEHYHLHVGQLRVGDKADFIVVDNLKEFNTQEVYIDGLKQYDAATPTQYAPSMPLPQLPNKFVHDRLHASTLQKGVSTGTPMIALIKNELLTSCYSYPGPAQPGNLESDPAHDIAKIVYINRYCNGTPQVAFCKGFNLKRGAFASSVAHDSHNIIAVGCTDSELTQAINAIIDHKGGLALCHDHHVEILPLPIGGIMTTKNGEEVACQYKSLSKSVQQLGCQLPAPFMTLAFMSLVVIPHLKIGEKGLFSYQEFNWIDPTP